MAEQQDYDSPWKELLDLQFEEFMAFFFPSAHAQIDWQAGHESLDKELQKIALDAALGRRVVDKLVKVQLTNGQEQWVLVHVEVQTQPALGFPERMFVYHYRIRDRFGARCATFGVLADGDPAWRPAEFRDELLGTELMLRFSTASCWTTRRIWRRWKLQPIPLAWWCWRIRVCGLRPLIRTPDWIGNSA